HNSTTVHTKGEARELTQSHSTFELSLHDTAALQIAEEQHFTAPYANSVTKHCNHAQSVGKHALASAKQLREKGCRRFPKGTAGLNRPLIRTIFAWIDAESSGEQNAIWAKTTLSAGSDAVE